MNVDMSTKHHQILQRYSLTSNSINIILSEVGGVDDCLGTEDLLGYKIVGEAKERDELDGGLACDKL